MLSADSGTVWIRRSPGGVQLILLRDGDMVILSSGHANQGGVLWQEVITLEGVRGWIQLDLLLNDEEEAG